MMQRQRVNPYDGFAAYYDLSSIDREGELTFYSKLLRQSDRSLLELACGTGTITVKLAELLFGRHGDQARVTGVDSSGDMLRYARRRDQRIEWIEGDMRAPPVSGVYDLILCPFNTLQLNLTNADLASTFSHVRNHLCPGGLFAFVIFNPNFSYLRSWPDERVVRSFIGPAGIPLELHESGIYNEPDSILSLGWTLRQRSDPGGQPVATLDLRLRQYLPDEIDELLQDSGLQILQRFGDLDRTPFIETAKHQVIVAGHRER